ncbi:MAG TPA: FKBP-type peptidyl-prolyl cis-trans isomerase, partial [Mycobacteriales bacterium]|nr:FKBP-type peptidyl-prolyl cis-trans isomerase [Mycobacteriales bacterium]
MTKSLVAALCVVVLVGTGCGTENSDDPTLTQSTESPGVQGPQAPSLTGCASAAPTVAPPAGASKDLTKKPSIEIPDTAPPCGLQIADIVVGTGRVAAAGQPLSMQYVGVTYADGKEFDTSWGADPFQFTLGEGRVIQGWD